MRQTSWIVPVSALPWLARAAPSWMLCTTALRTNWTAMPRTAQVVRRRLQILREELDLAAVIGGDALRERVEPVAICIP